MGKYPRKPSLAFLLASFLILAAQLVSAKQFNSPTSFRHPISARQLRNIKTKTQLQSVLESTYDIECGCCTCPSKEILTEPETTYRFILGPNANATLEFDYDERKQIAINFDLSLAQHANFSVCVWSNLDVPPIQATCEEKNKVPITIIQTPDENKFMISVSNPSSSVFATVPVKITFLDSQEGQNIPKWIIPVAIVIGALVLLGIIISVSYFKYAENRRRGRYLQHIPSNQNPHDVDVRFPAIKYEELKTDFMQITCSICLEDLQEGQLCRQFECQHIFHSQCGKAWVESQLQKSNKAACPTCNQQVMTVESNIDPNTDPIQDQNQ